jgi:lipoprotein-anchoring transpeptidase ErfK/SrfK
MLTLSSPANSKKNLTNYKIRAYKIAFLLLGIFPALLLCSCQAAPKKKKNPLDTSSKTEAYIMSKEVPTPPAPTKEGASIRVDRANMRAWLYQDGEMVLVSPVTPGKPGSSTPAGKFHVINKHRHWTSTIYHVPMPFFLRLNPGYFGLHEGPMRPYPASHGCIRLPRKEAEMFFNRTKIGTPVWIE